MRLLAAAAALAHLHNLVNDGDMPAVGNIVQDGLVPNSYVKLAGAIEEAHERATEPLELDRGLEPMLRWFEYSHLPPHLAEVSQPFGEVAAWLVALVPRSAERTVALRKLLEAKDAAVRARIEAA